MDLKNKMYILLLLLITSVSFADQSGLIYSIPIAGSQGLFDKFSSNVIPDNTSPDLQNVYTDKDMGIVSRKGYSRYFTLNSNNPVKQLYEYIQSNGARYNIAICSRSAYWITDTSSAIIKSGLSDYNHWIVTWQDKLYSGNMSDSVWNWDSVSVSYSTSIPKCEFAIVWGQRLLLARQIDNGSILYETFNNSDVIDEITSDGYELISPEDGDVITGMKLFQGQVIIFKRYSTWKIVGTYFGNMQVYNISKEIGCVDNGSIQEHRGVLKWLSHKGIMQFDGIGITKISEKIDITIDNISQVKSNKFSYIISNYEDFKQGVGFNIDSDTYKGSLTIPRYDGVNQQYICNPENMWYPHIDNAISNKLGQSFKVSITTAIYKIGLQIANARLGAPTPTGSVKVSIIKASDYSLIFSSPVNIDYLPVTDLTSGTNTFTYIYMPDTMLNAEEEYILTVSSEGLSGFSPSNAIYWLRESINKYSRGNGLYFVGNNRYNNNNYDNGFSLYLRNGALLTNYGSYTAPAKNINNIKSWGIFSVDQNLYTLSCSTIIVNYYVRSSSSQNSLNNTVWTQIYPNVKLSISTNTWIQFQTTFTYTYNINAEVVEQSINDIFKLNLIVFNYGSDYIFYQPCASSVYDDRYWLSVSTLTDNSNSTILIHDQRDNWTKFTGINASALAIFNQYLYSGDSNDTGRIYLQDTGYNDDNNAINSYYTTKSFSLGELYKRKVFNTVYSTVKTSSGTLNLTYKLDNTSTTWKGLDNSTTSTKINLNDISQNVIMNRTNFKFIPQGKYIQFMIQNNVLNEYFTLNDLSLIYGIKEIDY